MRFIVYGDIGGSGGYIRYCKGLLSSNRLPKNAEIWFISSKSFYEQISPLSANVNIITHPWIDSSNRIHRYLWYFWVYPRIVRKINPNVEFYPAGKLRVYLRKALTITTCHNLLLFDDIELNQIADDRERQEFLYSKEIQSKSFVKSDTVIFLSNNSKIVVEKMLPDIRKSVVIAHGLDTEFLLHEPRSYELGNRINILYVSPVYTYKHHLEVVAAVKNLRINTGLDICITLIGGGNSKSAIEFRAYLSQEDITDYVILKDNLEHKSLIQEYRNADLFVFASSCETFGITLLEGMGMRLPVACSDRTGLPEILKDAGVYFDPEDTESIESALRKLIEDKDLREACGEKAFVYAQAYTWDKCTDETFGCITRLSEAKNKLK